LLVADSLWGERGKPFAAPFLTSLSASFGAPLQQVDFAGAPSAAVGTINQWAAGATAGLIPQLLSEDAVNASTQLVLVNAVYFKGVWATHFVPESTAPGTFTRADGTTVSVPTMHGDIPGGWAQGKGFKLVELPYQGGALAMDLLLPESGSTLASLEPKLTPALLGSTLANLVHEETLIDLPRFSYASSLSLNDTLSALGMREAFADADFSGVDGAHDLSISAVIHQAHVQVDEAGTTAAAATAVTMGNAVPPTFTFDHPFAFIIRDTQSGSLLFIGRVEDPSAS
jgi:serpin B